MSCFPCSLSVLGMKLLFIHNSAVSYVYEALDTNLCSVYISELSVVGLYAT